MAFELPKTKDKALNAVLVQSEIEAAVGFGVHIVWDGFKLDANPRIRVKDTAAANPAQLTLVADQDLVPHSATIDTVLTDHDSSAKTTQEILEDNDTLDFDTLRSLYNVSGGLTESEKELAIDTMIRCVLRIGRNEQI